VQVTHDEALDQALKKAVVNIMLYGKAVIVVTAPHGVLEFNVLKKTDYELKSEE
jgi:hypothetical protein